ncbi:hypothetical protein HYT58_01180 [Candidatus Woesearchaeota archaeon]|nr:hypothetical protein [Candidatus Woesearchaeota archaeon]
MSLIFEVIDKTKRKIYLTEERWKHILKHSEMQNNLDEIKETLSNPQQIIIHPFKIRRYYRYYKNRKSSAKFLRIIVKYLNGEGFIITSYFVEEIK